MRKILFYILILVSIIINIENIIKFRQSDTKETKKKKILRVANIVITILFTINAGYYFYYSEFRDTNKQLINIHFFCILLFLYCLVTNIGKYKNEKLQENKNIYLASSLFYLFGIISSIVILLF